MEGRVIVADDDRTIRTVLAQALTRAGCKVRSTAAVSTLWRWVEEGEADVIVTDVMMPDGDALDLLPAIRRKQPRLPVIVMSAQNTVMTAIRAAEAGAFDYMPKPFDLSELLSLVNKALKQSTAAARAPHQTGPAAAPRPEDRMPLVGRSPAMQEVYRIMARLMMTDLGVMITGASGTGKDLVARALHDFGQRKNAPFVAINLAAIPPDQVESEMFGTGGQPGRFHEAMGGTLFLNEVGDMPPEAQTRLLRILQEGVLVDGGGPQSDARRADVRLIAATHRDLRAQINEGRFREDLFYRLNVVPLRLPPLAERIEDIPDLARHFLRQAEARGLPHKTISGEAVALLQRQTWSGNVRELQNMMQRLALLCPEDTISTDIVRAALTGPERGQAAMTESRSAQPQRLTGAVEEHLRRYFALHDADLPPDGLYDRILKEVEMPLIALSLAATRGNQLRAAQLLGLNRNTLRKKIRELDIRVSRGKKLM